jgi:hypothetical protein
MAEPLRHRQTKGRKQTCPAYRHRATSRLYPSRPLSLQPSRRERLSAPYLPFELPIRIGSVALIAELRRGARSGIMNQTDFTHSLSQLHQDLLGRDIVYPKRLGLGSVKTLIK